MILTSSNCVPTKDRLSFFVSFYKGFSEILIFEQQLVLWGLELLDIIPKCCRWRESWTSVQSPSQLGGYIKESTELDTSVTPAVAWY